MTVVTDAQAVGRKVAPEVKRVRDLAIALEDVLIQVLSSKGGALPSGQQSRTLQDLDLMVQTLEALEDVLEKLGSQTAPDLAVAAAGVKLEALKSRLIAA